MAVIAKQPDAAGIITTITFTKSDIGVFRKVAGDSTEFERNMAMLLNAVLSAHEERRQLAKVARDYAAIGRQLERALATIRGLPILERKQHNADAASLVAIAAAFAVERAKRVPTHRRVSVRALELAWGVARQFKDRNIPIVANDFPESLFVKVLSILCAAHGFVHTASAMKKLAQRAGVLHYPNLRDMTVWPLGFEGTFYSALGHDGIELGRPKQHMHWQYETMLNGAHKYGVLITDR